MLRISLLLCISFQVVANPFNLVDFVKSEYDSYDPIHWSGHFITKNGARINVPGIDFPRHDVPLYRGTTDHQYTLHKAVASMLGGDDYPMESKVFTVIRSKLMGISSPVAASISSHQKSEVADIRSQYGGDLNLSEAVRAAARILDETYEYYANHKKSHLDQRIDYRSSHGYIDWPDDVVFTTPFVLPASTYGNNIVEFFEHTPRSLDLNLFNRHQRVKENSSVRSRNEMSAAGFMDHGRDAGEFLAMGYIPGSDVTGFELRKPPGRSGPNYEIKYGFYKIMVADQPFILVVSPEMDYRGWTSRCMMRIMPLENNEIHHCDTRQGMMQIMALPSLNERVKPIGYIALCAKRSSCYQLDVKALGYNKLATKNLSPDHVKEIESVTIEDKSAYFFSLNN